MGPFRLGVAGGAHYQRQAVGGGVIHGGSGGGVEGEVQDGALGPNLGEAGVDSLAAPGVYQSGGLRTGVTGLKELPKLPAHGAGGAVDQYFHAKTPSFFISSRRTARRLSSIGVRGRRTAPEP